MTMNILGGTTSGSLSGANSHGQLGHGNIDEEELLKPKQVDLSPTKLKPDDIVKIVGGAGHTLLLDKSGVVYSCGWNTKGQAGNKAASARFQKLKCLENQKIVDVACGWNSTMVLSENGEIFVWGSNSHGQLGTKEIVLGGKTDRPVKVELNVAVQRISMGLRHSAVIARDFRVLVCGAATKGQLGVDLHGARYSDTFIEVPGVKDAISISCGQHHTVIVTKNNEVYSWGDNKHGQLGIHPALHKTAFAPIKVENCSNLDSFSEIYCGWTHSVIFIPDKKVISWGRNAYGQLGRAKDTPISDLWKPQDLTFLSKIKQLLVGSEHNIALTEDGTVLSWGWNEHGNCGNGSTEDTFEPTKVQLPEGSGVLIGIGAGHSFAVIETNC